MITLCAQATASTAAEGDLSLSSFVASATERAVGPLPVSQGPGAVLVALSDTETFPIGCATPLVQALAGAPQPASAPLSRALAALAVRPFLESERTTLTRDARFVIHYSDTATSLGARPADRDRNGLPDPIDRYSEALVAARSFLITRLGYPAPVAEDQRFDVYLVPIGHGLEGFLVPGGASEGLPAPSGTPFIVLDANLPTDRIMPAVLHQVAHASLASLASRTASWWSEASASFVTLAATGDLKGFEAALGARLRSPGVGLASEDLLKMQGGLLWPLFLSERLENPGIVRQIWGEIAIRGLDPMEATAQVARRSSGLRLPDLIREYAIWNLFTGPRDDGRHYSIGRSLPEAALPVVGPSLPIALDPVEPLDPLGSIAFRLVGDRQPGALDLDLKGEGGLPAADLLVFSGSDGGAPILVAAGLDGSGAARVSIPWGDTREAWIILRNDAPEGAASFSVRGAHDPYAPYDLASLTAAALGPSIALEWTTASEQGMVGWNIYRAEFPSGPFTRLNAVAVPASGDGSNETGYIFLDDSARPGRRYYYLIEGLTTLGLAERSHLVSGRVPGRS